MLVDILFLQFHWPTGTVFSENRVGLLSQKTGLEIWLSHRPSCIFFATLICKLQFPHQENRDNIPLKACYEAFIKSCTTPTELPSKIEEMKDRSIEQGCS